MGFEIGPARPGEWDQVVLWAAKEGWNPGRHDSEHFLMQDPRGFLLGRLDGKVVSAISVVNYSPDYAFLGYYLVRPDRRGQGFGIATWKAGMQHAGSRTIGLDGVPDQQDNYRTQGFLPAYTTVRYRGRPNLEHKAEDVEGVVPVGPEHLDLLAALDAAGHPADRHPFASRWAADPRHVTRARFRDGLLTGYGVLRPANEGVRIGPLLATTPRDAAAVLASLLREAGDATVAIDIPEPHHVARNLAELHGLTPSSRTARMYTGPIRSLQQSLVYGVMSLELG
ncbi:GNAT family N-acetyltransferase [Actinospica sp. MGRD01-02]|uniref:GNAT family N-acetyltransferase n=1 Tax=Actinospica acidithermotolerans TaxID=2828514 RepID=A0A941IH68_9ACTN|nr:GNAT family N-acetyltransferase [Actinospica acidithermotolerans]MBR7826889.1 GNAT family N-acetyltransferase [Actinospica acidithermotolerans]